MMKYSSSKYLRRLILFSSILCSVPVLISGYFSYLKASDKIQEKVNEGNKQILTQTEMRVEQILKTVDTTITQFANSPIIGNSLQKNLTSEDFIIAGELSQRLHLLQASNLGLYDMYLINLNKEWGMNNSGMFRFNEVERTAHYVDYANEPRPSFWVKETTFPTDGNPDKEDHEYTINFVKKLPINTLNPTGLVIAEISGYKIKELVTGSSNLGQMMILDQDYRLLDYERDDGKFAQNLLTETIVGQLKQMSRESGYLDTYLESVGKVGITFRKSAYNGWIYLSIMKESDITKESKTIGWITMYTCLGITLLAFLFSVFGSTKMYIPIKRIYENLAGSLETEIPKSGKDEIQMIDEGLSRLLVTKSMMASQITVQMQSLKELFVLKLFQGALKPKEIAEKLASFGYPSSFDWLCVLNLQVDTIMNPRYKEEDRDLLMYAINNIVSDHIPQEYRLSPILYEQSQVTLVGGNQQSLEQFKTDIYTLVEDIQKAVEHYLELTVSIGISRPFHDFVHTPKAYQEGIEALKYRIQFGRGIILCFDDLTPVQTVRYLIPERIENELIDSIKGNEQEKAEELLHRFIVEVFKPEASNQDYQVHLVRLLMELIRLAEKGGESLQSLIGSETSLFDQLFSLHTIQDIEKWFANTLIPPIMAALQMQRELPYHTISDQIVHMIHDEYDLDLTLDLCASRLNLHPNYVGKVFLKETGSKFSDYLLQYRLKIAQKWLIDSDLKISEIADKLRYNNPQNFIRYFRKMVGITPGQFREQNK
ncbi:helix-turn-helix domain-containing protein [Paenibacillus piri]|uniref:AraC family transcriptional regulator n=1 Tax=Paenibacillus piri TaxID=2547395 RepID=A0A4R5KH16_9BACL|nr:helix-turn-helix domain-containing protein [Paenibacillus piri]TDF94028.1 AraC family transcriptional regulator [Paenibacillus piri]